jgi:hypothetical protein
MNTNRVVERRSCIDVWTIATGLFLLVALFKMEPGLVGQLKEILK